MGAAPSSLEIHVHSTDGLVSRFQQTDAEAARKLFGQFQPGRIFAQPHLIVAGGTSMSVFPTAAVARVDLVMDGFPEWPFYHGVSDVQEITEEQFRERYRPERYSAGLARTPGAAMAVFGEIELANGERIFVEVQIQVEPRLPVEQGLFIQQILSAHSLYARRRGGGAVVLNPANIVRLTFHPGPPETPPNALCATPLEATGITELRLGNESD
jgi:hypothetical protein